MTDTTRFSGREEKNSLFSADYAKSPRFSLEKMLVAWLSRLTAVPENALRLLISVLIGESLIRTEFIEKIQKIRKNLIDFPFIDFSREYFFPLSAYPIVICYRCFLHNNVNITKKHTNLLFAACGIAICIFNYGFDVYHSLIAVTFTYVIINLLYNSRYLVPVSFIFHMTYLLWGN